MARHDPDLALGPFADLVRCEVQLLGHDGIPPLMHVSGIAFGCPKCKNSEFTYRPPEGTVAYVSRTGNQRSMVIANRRELLARLAGWAP
jgi:phage FluMu protein Com